MSNFTHVLITRFNIYIPNWDLVDKHGRETRSKEWMEHRFELFNKYCVPSVAAQTCDNFKWVILVDQHTPQEYIHRIGRGVLLTGNFWLRDLQKFLENNCKTRHLITTRLDNDDVLAPWAIQQIQDSFTNQRFTFLDLPSGYRLKDGILHKHQEACNPFLSLVERDTRQCVLSQAHGRKLGRENKVEVISNLPAWIQVIHDRNKITDKTPGPVTVGVNWAGRYV